MKNLINIFRTTVQRVCSVALVAASMLAISESAWAITFGIKGNYGMPSNYTMISMTQSPTNTFTYSFTASGSGENYVKFYKNETEGNSTCVTTSSSVSPVSYGTQYSCTVGAYKEFKMLITKDVTYTCKVVYNSDSDVKVTISSSDAPASTWKLVGEFTSWAYASSPAFTQKSTNVYTLSYYFENGTEYANGTKDKGFKVTDSNNWYGNGSVKYTATATKTINGTGDTDNFGFKAGISGYYTFEFNSSTKALTVTYPTVKTTPTVRWGEAPSVSSNNIVASAHIAGVGCNGSSVTNLRVRFWKKDEPDVIKTVEASQTCNLNNTYSFNIPWDNELLLSCADETDIVMEVGAKNSNGWSAYSDQIVIAYTSKKELATHNLDLDDFTSCSGAYRFKLSDMVVPTSLDSWSAVRTGETADASSDFRITEDGYMEWQNIESKTAGYYSYTFTVAKDGYAAGSPEHPVVTFTFVKTVPTGSIESIAASASTSTPWESVTLTATKSAGATNIDKIIWTVDKDGAYVTDGGSVTTAVFRGGEPGTYTVTATGQSSDCVTIESKSSEPITVTADDEKGDC